MEPNAKILVGGLLFVNPKTKGESKFTPERFIAKMGHRAAYDAVGLHPYVFKASYGGKRTGPPRGPTEVTQVKTRVRSAIMKFRHALNVVEGSSGEPRKRIWIDEIGWPVENTGEKAPQSHPTVSLNVQAELIRSTFQMIKAKSKDWAIDKVFYWAAIDLPGAPDWSFSCGLQGDLGEFRPSWSAFQEEAK